MLHESDSELFSQYLNLIENAGTQNQRFEAIQEARVWLDNNYDNSNVRTKYLRLVREHGTMEQKQVAIEETSIWLELPECEENSDVFTQFLTLVEKEGTSEKKKEMITKTDFWLRKYPDKSDVRSKFLSIIKKRGREFSDIQSIIIRQWEWINNKKKVDQLLWTAFLPALEYCDDPTIIKEACESARIQYPENIRIIGICLKHLQNYLPIEISRSLAYQLEKLIDISKLPIIELRPYLLEAANFLRENNDLDTAGKIYLRIINWSKEKKRKDALETLKAASGNYEYLLVLKSKKCK